jgi:hypothetical protein
MVSSRDADHREVVAPPDPRLVLAGSMRACAAVAKAAERPRHCRRGDAAWTAGKVLLRRNGLRRLACWSADIRRCPLFTLDGPRSSADIAGKIPDQEASVERHRTGGMTVIAVLDIIVGGLVILGGLFEALGAAVFMYELLRLGGGLEIPAARATFSLLLLATGTVGIIAGIGMFAPRSWARALSLVYAGLLIVSAVSSFLVVPIIASIGAYDLGSLGAYDLARLILFSAVYAVLPLAYSLVLCVVFCTPAWKAAFAKGWPA